MFIYVQTVNSHEKLSFQTETMKFFQRILNENTEYDKTNLNETNYAQPSLSMGISNIVLPNFMLN